MISTECQKKILVTAKIACVEEIAFRRGFIDAAGLRQVISDTPKSSYRDKRSQLYHIESSLLS